MATRAQTLRKNPTSPEVRYWRLIEPLRLNGHHFRKQSPIGRYVVDFVCHRAKLVVEIDGDTHFSDTAVLVDARRTAFLNGEGYSVLRFTNHEVMTNPDGVYAMTLARLAPEDRDAQ